MTRNVQRTRRNTIDQRAVIPLAQIAGLLAAMSPASPTGDTTTDILLLGIGGALLTWICASASWWSLVLGSGVATGIGLNVTAASMAVVGLGVALWISFRKRSMSVHRTIVGGLIINSLLRSDLGGFAGLSSIIGLSIAIILYLNGTYRRNRRQQRWIYGIGLGLVAYAAIAGSIMSASALVTRSTL
ncbi:MAG: hypothetical protein ACO3SP_10990, partial [Ilumatobacteraceae bacterium]